MISTRRLFSAVASSPSLRRVKYADQYRALAAATSAVPSSSSYSPVPPAGQFHIARAAAIPPLCRTTTTTTTRSFAASASLIPPNPAMLCRQCEQTQDGIACTTLGICGKTAEVSNAQDALVHVVKCVSLWCVAARRAGVTEEELRDANVWSLRSAFSTLTNVNFDEERIAEYLKEGMQIKKDLMGLISSKGVVGADAFPTGPVADLTLDPSMSCSDLEEFGKSVGILARQAAMKNDDCFSLTEIATAGAKGVSAYASHCYQLGYIDEANIIAPLHEVWSKLASDEPDLEGLLATTLRVGEINLATLALLDEAHNGTYGAAVPTEVRMTPVAGKCILVSGHDMGDLYALLVQTEGKGINVYTHGEMLPAHGYPEMKKFPHLVGNYGTAWQNQKIEFATFPGPVVVTTNCIQEPRKKYRDRIWAMNEVGVSNVKHLPDGRDFTPVIEQALKCKGFASDATPVKYTTVGFNHRAVLPLAGEVITAAQEGQLSRIFLIGGCDGTESERSYYTDLAESTPDDSLILTLGCAKNRVIHSEKLRGATLSNGIPRVLDMGQCNDSYSAVVVAMELAKALNCGINDLPLSLAISHLEQKAAAVLLTLLHLGVKNIRLGPRLPAYITPGILQVLVDKYNLMPVGADAKEDLKLMMEGK